MRLYALEPSYGVKLKSKLRKIQKGLEKEVIIGERAFQINSLIVLANGDIDDRIIGITCKHLDGEKVLGVVKPQVTHISTLTCLPDYLKKLSFSDFPHFVFVMDQEYYSLDKIRQEAEEKFKKMQIEFEKIEENRRLWKYECKLGKQQFILILIINGVEEIKIKKHSKIRAEKHCIEDHLLLAASKLKIIELPNEIEDSKELWRKIEEKKRLQVFRKLLNDKKFAEELFPQHFKGLKLIN